MTQPRFFNELNNEDYKSLFTLIQKNTALKMAVDAIDPKDEGMQKLLSEIKQGKFTLDSFSNKDCDIYLLRLLKDNKISYPVFFTAYSYLMILIETKNIDYDYEGMTTTKNVRQVETFNLWDDEKNQLSERGEEYIKNLCSAYAELEEFMGGIPAIKRLREQINSEGLTLSDYLYERLVTHITTLDPAERIVVIANLPKNDFLEQFLSGYPSVKKMTATNISYHSPSYSIHDWLNKQLCNEPLRARACFGRLTRESLLSLHHNNIHPYPICSRFVKFNMNEAHNDPYGPHSVAQHDLGHVFFASCAPKEDRAQFLTLSSFLLKLRDELDKNQVMPEKLKQNLKKYFDSHFDELNDLILLPYNRNWKEDITRDITYRIKSLAKSESATNRKILYQFFKDLNTQEGRDNPIKIAIEAAISTLEKNHPELATESSLGTRARKSS